MQFYQLYDSFEKKLRKFDRKIIIDMNHGKNNVFDRAVFNQKL
jgi:hypothetical protein